MSKQIRKTLHLLVSCFVSVWYCGAATAQLMQSPVIAAGATAPPLVLLTMSRDDKLVAPAYNDYSDLNGDGVTDVGYNPSPNFLYFGNFSSSLCYTYVSGKERFDPIAQASAKKCSGSWSGDFLNYVTTSRIDALRKSLYGGYRVVDTFAETVLERGYVPQDAHVWGKEYDRTRSTYSISDYTPLAAPAAGQRHLFANVTLIGTNKPLLRVLTNRTERIWNWVLKEKPVADTALDDQNGAANPTDFVLRTLVCVAEPNLRDSDCKQYISPNDPAKISYKPTGILHDFGENRTIAFGLLTGSYQNARAGGVLRRNIEYFDSEINVADGTFKYDVPGIVNTINKIRIAEFSRGGTYFNYDCNPRQQGDCVDFVNPVAEMMYEGLRYLASGKAPTPDYGYTQAGSLDDELGLSTETWKDPFRSPLNGGFPYCAKPIQMVISDIKPTFDSDDLPGSAFASSFSAPSEPAKMAGLNVASVAGSIWANEGLSGGRYFIGESLANTPSYDQSPSLKTVNSFSNIRGLAPEVPTRQGSFYSASVAKFGKETNFAPAASARARNVDTYAIALSTPLPAFNIPVGGSVVKVIPVGQSLVGCSFGGFEQGKSFPANRIVGFYIDQVENILGYPTTATNGGRPFAKFRVGFEDNEEGTDNDMDAIVSYEIRVTVDNKVEVTLNAEYAAGCIGQHLGFVISGTSEDQTYLGVRDPDTPCSADQLFPDKGDDVANSSLNTGLTRPSWLAAGDVCRDANGVATGLGTRYQRTFTPAGDGTGGTIPNDPLWYSVKYGGPKAPAVNGKNPEGYFLVTNPGLLRAQLTAAFDSITANLKSGQSGLRFTGNLVRGLTQVYSPRYEAENWSGAVDAFNVDSKTGLKTTRIWSTAEDAQLAPPDQASVAWKGRKIYTFIVDNWQQLKADTTADPIYSDTSLRTLLVTSSVIGAFPTETADLRLQRIVDYVRGDPTYEKKYGGTLRSRGGVVTNTDPSAGGFLNVTSGSVVNSTLAVQGLQDFGHAAFPGTMTESASYSAYVASKKLKPSILYFGSNEGMLHAVQTGGASRGREQWAFIPRAVQRYLSRFSSDSYSHRYTVDGPITVADYYDGGWKTVLVGTTGAGARSVYAIDVTSPLSPRFLWEVDGNDIAALGHVLATPTVVRDTSGKWVVVVGNGYESSSQITAAGAVVIIELTKATPPSVPPHHVITATGVLAKNGFSSPAILSPTGSARNGWVGDLEGNVWRLKLSGAYNTWSLGTKLFEAAYGTKRQPITSRPSVIASPVGGNIVLFGTGKFFEVTDPTSLDVQTFYSVYDDGSTKVAKNDLTKIKVTTSAGSRFLALDGAEKERGYFVDFLEGSTPRGERIVAGPSVVFGIAAFNTIQTNVADVCQPGLSGSTMFIQADSGDAPDESFFGETGKAGVVGPGSLTGVTALTTPTGELVFAAGTDAPLKPEGKPPTTGGSAPSCATDPSQARCNPLKDPSKARTGWRVVF
jgi:type IV pilus assembly protein PilY1